MAKKTPEHLNYQAYSQNLDHLEELSQSIADFGSIYAGKGLISDPEGNQAIFAAHGACVAKMREAFTELAVIEEMLRPAKPERRGLIALILRVLFPWSRAAR